jgi:hypothetical protein
MGNDATSCALHHLGARIFQALPGPMDWDGDARAESEIAIEERVDHDRWSRDVHDVKLAIRASSQELDAQF